MTLEDKLLKKTESIDKCLNEIFVVKKGPSLQHDLEEFLKQQFEKGNLEAVHQGLSTTEYKPEDWYEDMADNMINRLIEYFRVIRGQTERDL